MISFNEVSKHYPDGTAALEGVNFSVNPGEFVFIVGPSGAGKTLALRAMAGLIRPSGGRLRIGDRLLDDSARGIHRSPQERRVGYVPQNYALFPHLNLSDNIAYGLQALPRERARAGDEALLGEDPGGREERDADPAQGERRAGAERGAGG